MKINFKDPTLLNTTIGELISLGELIHLGDLKKPSDEVEE